MATPKKMNLSYKIDTRYMGSEAEAKHQYKTEGNPDNRDEKHAREIGEAIYTALVNGNTGIYSEWQDKFAELRRYGKGKQSSDIYKRFFTRPYDSNDPGIISQPGSDIDDGKSGFSGTQTEHERKGYMNVLWDVVSPAIKIRNKLLGTFAKADYDLPVDAVDERSGAIKERMKYHLWMVKENLDFLKKYYANMGLNYKEPKFLPENEAELELYDERGGFKLEFCKSLEIIITNAIRECTWDQIKLKLNEDAIDIGVFGIKNEIDHKTNLVLPKWLDPELSVCEYSEYNDFRDINYAGHFEDITIGELRAMNVFTDEQLEQLASDYVGYKTNPQDFQEYRSNHEYKGVKEICHFDFFTVCVFKYEWKETDIEYIKKYETKSGKKRVKRSYEKLKGDNVEEFCTEQVHYGEWIVGSDLMVDYGPRYEVVRKDPKYASLSYFFYRLPSESITSILYKVYDQFAILWYKYQNAIAQARNAGYAVDYDSLSNISLGGEENEEIEILRRFLETNIMIFKRTDNIDGTKNSLPIYDLPGNLPEVFREFRDGFLFLDQFIESLTGFNAVTLGGTPDKEAPVATSEMAYHSTNQSLSVILDGYLSIKQRVFDNVSAWTHIRIISDENVRKIYEDIMGRNMVEVLKLAHPDKTRYGIKPVPRPTDEEWQYVFSSAMESLKNGRDGKPGINEADFFTIMHIKQTNGSIKLAEMILEHKIRVKEKEAAAREQERMQFQGEQERQTADLKHQREIEIIEKEKSWDERLLMLEHKNKMQEIEIKAKYDQDINDDKLNSAEDIQDKKNRNALQVKQIEARKQEKEKEKAESK